MCSPSGSNAAKKEAREAAIEEKKRQTRIKQGQNNIDLAFKGFNDQWFDKYRGDFENYYLPELDQQFGDAKKGLTFNLARTGNLKASTAGDQFGNAQNKYLDARTDIANKALDSVNTLKGRIEDQKSNLYALNSSAADPGLAMARAASAASLINQPPAYSPLGDVFASMLNSGAQVIGAERQGYRGTGTGLFSPGGTSGSAIYVS